jgi:ribonucleoside-diphosphate reductase alpha chain
MNPKQAAKRNGTSAHALVPTINLATGAISTAVVDSPATQTARSDQFASFQTDAPACDNCGAITVRNGNCYLCHNCGSSMGCS